MEENRERRYELEDKAKQRAGLNASHWLAIAVVAMIIVAGAAFVFGYRQQVMAAHLRSHEADMNATMNQMQSQIDGMTAKLSQKSAAQAATPSASAPVGNGARPALAKQRVGNDKRFKQIQSQLDAQQKQLSPAQADLRRTQSDLEGNLSSRRDELNGSIAKTKDKLVALEKRGARSHFEFDLYKGKQFQRTGPISVPLRKVHPKLRHFDLTLLVDDNQLTKKNVNLYEPIWIHDADESQPVRVGVNKIDKNHVHGYVSAP